MSHIGRSERLPQPLIEDAAIELLICRAYDAAHPDDSFEDLKHRASFSRDAAGLLRAWVRAARSGALGSIEPPVPDDEASVQEARAA